MYGLGRQLSSSLLPRLQGNTSLEILIKEASGCPVLLLEAFPNQLPCQVLPLSSYTRTCMKLTRDTLPK